MAYNVIIETLPTQNVAAVSARVSRDEIAQFLGGVFAEVLQAAQAQGAQPVGPPFARYAVVDEAFEVMAGFPVWPAISTSGRVEPGRLPGGDVATTVHRGPYEEVGEAFHAVIDWIAQHGRQIAADPWESYLDGPEVDQPRTKVCFPLVPR